MGLMIRDLAGIVFRMGVIPGSQRHDTSSLGIVIAEVLRRLLVLSYI